MVTSLIKRLIRGTFHGRFEPKYLQNYLDEYAFRFNRRKSKSIGKKFMRIVQQVVKSVKITYPEISGYRPDFRILCNLTFIENQNLYFSSAYWEINLRKTWKKKMILLEKYLIRIFKLKDSEPKLIL